MTSFANMASVSPEILHPSRPKPFVKIVEQPSRSLRYRYICEGRPGTIPGASSTADHKTPFAIQVVGYQGRVVVLVSCVSNDPPYRPHPHNLVGQNCKKGVCSFEADITTANSIVRFPKLAVQCIKRADAAEALRVREEKNIDPYRTGFEHKNNVKSIDLHRVRLCFQVFLTGENKRLMALEPVMSEPIYNKKAIPNPLIHRLSQCNSSVKGRNDDIILLCTKISKDDIKIRFFETKNGDVVWEDFATFHPSHVYNNSAICFRPPKYHDQHIVDPARVWIQLVRPSDDAVSPAVEFEYLPLEAESGALKEKRRKCKSNALAGILAPLLDVCSPQEKEKLMVGTKTNDVVTFPWSLEMLTPSPQNNLDSAVRPETLTVFSWTGETQDSLNNQNLARPKTNDTAGFPWTMEKLTPSPQETQNLARPKTNDSSGFPWTIEKLTPSPQETLINHNGHLIKDVPWFEVLTPSPGSVNQNEASSSGRPSLEFPVWNIISDDLSKGTAVNIDSASGIGQVLNIDCNQIELPSLHISSGDLEMNDVEHLSGSLQEHLVL